MVVTGVKTAFAESEPRASRGDGGAVAQGSHNPADQPDRACDHARGHTKLTTTDTYLNATTRLLYELTSG